MKEQADQARAALTCGMVSAARTSEISPPLHVQVGGTDGPEDPRLRPAVQWFSARGWSPFEFQRRAWAAYLEGRDGLVHAPTGTGKTYAVWMGPLLEAVAESGRQAATSGAVVKRK